MSRSGCGCALALLFAAFFWAVVLVIVALVGAWTGFWKVVAQ